MTIARFWKTKELTQKLRNNASAMAEHRWASGIVFLLELGGCTVLPIPVALILMGLVFAAPRKWLRFGLGATAGSMAGALVLYIIGRGFFYSFGKQLISFYGSEAGWAGVVEWFQSEWGLAFIALAGLTTGLFRVACIGAGFTGMNPLEFFFVLILSRGARWVAECAAIKFVGQRMWRWPGHYFKYATAGAVLLLLFTLLALTLAA
ncbi:MAG TPA: hypothetical protein VFQ92_25400 [Blastocatellia bacterium]|nr:hypothetical protein [Blastocatellia bacterium]